MNHRFARFVVVCLGAFAVLCGTVFAEDAEMIKKMEKERAAAVVAGNWEKLARETADDYTFINQNGAMTTKTQMIEAFKSGQSKITTDEVSDMTVRFYGDVAIITGNLEVKGMLAGKDVTGKARFTRVYVKKGGHWEAAALQQTRVQ